MTVQRYVCEKLTLDRAAIGRWLGVRSQLQDDAQAALIDEAAAFLEQGTYSVCWCRLPLTFIENTIDFGKQFRVCSRSLCQWLAGCSQAVVFCATLGAAVDRRLLSLRLRPAKAAVLDAAAGVAIESLCDSFCAQLSQPSRPRFSPGYGDLPLEMQKPLLALLDAQRQLGVTLTDALLMTPTKSVTAIVGLL